MSNSGSSITTTITEEVQKIQESASPDTSTSTDSNLRYAAYANRFRTILQASHRYVAYTSDIGESFRPVAHPAIVRLGYGVSWAYILGDVGYEAWKAKLRQEGRYMPGLQPWDKRQPTEVDLIAQSAYTGLDWRLLAVKRAIFQSIASMGLPAFTIHSSVRYSSILFKNSGSAFLKTYGPVAVGLGIVPLLPYLFDEPVEHAIDYIFDKGVGAYNKYQTKLE